MLLPSNFGFFHPVCLSSGEGVTFEMEKYFTAAQPELGLKAKRILEINVDHPAFLTFEKTLSIPRSFKKTGYTPSDHRGNGQYALYRRALAGRL